MIEILFGPIASGKSTYARKRAEEGAIIVNDDAIVTALHGGNYSLYRETLKPVYKAAQSAMISHALIDRQDVVVDTTARHRPTRDRLRLTALAFDTSSRLVIFRRGYFSGVEDGERRYEADPRGLTLEQWRDIGRRHAGTYDPLTPSEEKLYTYITDIDWEDNYDNA